MKVIQINGNAYRGSTGGIVRQISDCLDSHQEENFIICSGFREKPLDEKTLIVSSKWQKKLHQVLGYIFGDTGFHSFFATRKVIRILKNKKPDIVHLHHLEGYFLNVEKLLKYLKRTCTKTVWTLHDCWAFTGHCTHFLAAGCDRWQTECHNCPQRRKYPYSLFFDRSRSLFKRKKNLLSDFNQLYIVNVSEWMQSIVFNSFLRSRPMQVIYNGIDTNTFAPCGNPDALKKELGLEGKYVILGVATTWGEGKGLGVFRELAQKLPEDTVILLVGMTAAQISKMPHGIIGVERTASKEELCKYYASADVFMSLSLEETMGLVTVEALSCGTPGIVCNSSASPELIGERCGEILPKRTVENILLAVDTIRNNGKKYYTDYARAFAISNFSEASMKDRYYNLYNQICGEL